ncbi:PEP/pyruvate-binding domain-containing protein [Salinibacterium sp. ZJ450]|uniref:PEP/pyruvate-binding domain-containing protein n=1 Tax=Salinibacterium sp. ZJ450 TaxID=2708338 RepID=UPI0014221E47|nr:PEP/pyruvate-binding domain-containing protein [Salinibacterium sp. ZJ450]
MYITRFGELGRADVALAGGKGANLGELVGAGFAVPDGFVLTTDAYEAFVYANSLEPDIRALAVVAPTAEPQAFAAASAEIRALFTAGVMPEAIAAELRQAYEELTGADVAVAVRSSATAEDLPTASFAGQQDSYLNIRGIRALTDAVVNCWASLWTARAMAYRAREGIAPDTVSLAVVVQQMVESAASGVMFTANPTSGRRDQVVISAAWGLGESVVSGSVTPDDLVIAADTGAVLSRRTADKQVMTVLADEGTREQPVPDARRREPVLDDRAAARLAQLGTRIADHFGAPQDIEWALTDAEFQVVQARPITALPEPAAETPTTWTPARRGLYFRASIVEQLPDPLSPLFADLIDSSVTRSLESLLSRVFASGGPRGGDLGLPTVNGYAYYYYRPAFFWGLLLKSPAALGVLFRGGAEMGLAGWQQQAHPRYVHVVEQWAAEPVQAMPAQRLLDGVLALLDAGTSYYTAVQSVIPVAATSEGLFRAFYERFVRRPGDPPALTFLLGYESEPIRAEESLWDLAAWTRDEPGLASAILAAPEADLAEALASGAAPAGVDAEAWQQWHTRFRSHLDRFGHAVYNLDFASPVPADNPSTLLATLRFYLSGQGVDPHQRQAASAARRAAHTRVMRRRLGRVRRTAFGRLMRWAQRAAPMREDALADIGLGWPLMRRMLLELGSRLARSGVIGAPADVFWLRRTELVSAIAFGLANPSGGGVAGPETDVAASPPVSISGAPRPVRADAIEKRKMLWRGRRRANPPQLLPQKGLVSRLSVRWMPAGSQDQQGEVISGVGASAGQVSAPARVLAGPEEFGQMQPGEVLVARMTTPAWTSLFAMASAVVTDVGGPLSHSSIVAREYGIPAVLGTGVATQRLTSGQVIRVDGDAGTVTVARDARRAR